MRFHQPQGSQNRQFQGEKQVCPVALIQTLVDMSIQSPQLTHLRESSPTISSA
jgi:hypothetical protein